MASVVSNIQRWIRDMMNAAGQLPSAYSPPKGTVRIEDPEYRRRKAQEATILNAFPLLRLRNSRPGKWPPWSGLYMEDLPTTTEGAFASPEEVQARAENRKLKKKKSATFNWPTLLDTYLWKNNS